MQVKIEPDLAIDLEQLDALTFARLGIYVHDEGAEAEYLTGVSDDEPRYQIYQGNCLLGEFSAADLLENFGNDLNRAAISLLSPRAWFQAREDVRAELVDPYRVEYF